MSELADALVRQVNELKASAEKAERERDNLERAMIDQVCPSCEGPLTCAKCTVKEYPSSRLNDHEARIKELDTLVQVMGERVNDHERRLRSLEGKRK